MLRKPIFHPYILLAAVHIAHIAATAVTAVENALSSSNVFEIRTAVLSTLTVFLLFIKPPENQM